MPWSRPAPTFAAPCANDSWSMSTRYRCRAANVRASPAVCENPIITSATDASATVATLSSSSATSGTSTDGSPRGTSPTRATPRSPRSNSQVASSPPTTRTSAPGTRGATRRSPNTVTSATTPTTTVARFTSPSVPSQDQSSCGGVDPSALVPVILGSSPTTTSIAAPNRNPVTTARERNCAIQPILSTARTRNTTPGHERDPGDERRRLRTREADGEDRARGDGGQPGAGAGRDLPAGAEDRVEDRPGRSGVQTVLQRDARDPRVPEVLRDDQRRDGDARGHVGPQPPTVVGAQHADDRHPVRPATTLRTHLRTIASGRPPSGGDPRVVLPVTFEPPAAGHPGRRRRHPRAAPVPGGLDGRERHGAVAAGVAAPRAHRRARSTPASGTSCATSELGLVGTVRLLWTDPDFWGDDHTPAVYVHGLMVDRRAAGHGLGHDAARLGGSPRARRRGGPVPARLPDHQPRHPRLLRAVRVPGGRAAGLRRLLVHAAGALPTLGA